MIGLTQREKEQAYLEAENMIWQLAWTYRDMGLSVDDLFQYGALGFTKACNKFNKTLGTKITTYAYPFIKYEIFDALNLNNNFIHIPKERMKRYKDLNKIIDDNLGSVDYDEIQAKLGLDYYQVIDLLTDVPTVVRHDEYEMFEDSSLDPSELYELESKEEALLEFVGSKLTKKQYEAVMLRHGFYTGKVETFDQIGKYLGITQQAARGLFMRATETLKEYEEEIRQYV